MSDLISATPAIPEKLRRWLEWAVQVGASDLHLIVGYPPVIRLNGDLTELPNRDHTRRDDAAPGRGVSRRGS